MFVVKFDAYPTCLLVKSTFVIMIYQTIVGDISRVCCDDES